MAEIMLGIRARLRFAEWSIVNEPVIGAYPAEIDARIVVEREFRIFIGAVRWREVLAEDDRHAG
jgi:hypothetical protein